MLCSAPVYKRKYSGNALSTMSNGQGITKLVELSKRRWGVQVLGIYAKRDKRSKPGNLSVHALWRAADLRFKSVAERNNALDWFVEYNHQLKIDCLIDYAYSKRDKLGRRAYGRAWMCDRQAWKPLRKGEVSGGGEAWADFIHIELGSGYPTTESGVLFEKEWRTLPRP